MRDRIAVLIGVLKLAKAATLIAAGVALLALHHDGLVRVVHGLNLSPGAHVVRGAFGRLLGLSERDLALLALALFAYGALFGTEGTALVAGWSWSHGFAIVVTGSFIPIEIFELSRRASVARAAVLATNIAIVIYLAVRLAQRHRRRRAAYA